jgi:hypothetical protein
VIAKYGMLELRSFAVAQTAVDARAVHFFLASQARPQPFGNSFSTTISIPVPSTAVLS